MARSAVCVGINEFKHAPDEQLADGCVNDADDISAALKKYGFTARTTTVLRDAEATKKAVIGALTTMVDKAKPGDHLVFSSRATARRCRTSPARRTSPTASTRSSPAARSSGWRPGWDRNTVIVDDELHDLFQRVPRRGPPRGPPRHLPQRDRPQATSTTSSRPCLGARPRFLPPPTPRGLDRARTIREHTPPGRSTARPSSS